MHVNLVKTVNLVGLVFFFIHFYYNKILMPSMKLNKPCLCISFEKERKTDDGKL